jgi:hypothetical protein
MILYHGTSTSRSIRILEHGFEYPDFESEIQEIARRYDVKSEQLTEQLVTLNRFVASRFQDENIYFSSDFMHAASYATRAPEFYWEALWAVYIIWNPELGDDWNQSDAGHAWVLSQMHTDPPVVLHVNVCEDLLGLDAERIRETQEIFKDLGDGGRVEVGLTASSDLQIIDQTSTDFWIDPSLLRFMAGISPDEIHAQVLAGAWGQPFSYQSTKYWLWGDIKARLSHQRLFELNLV